MPCVTNIEYLLEHAVDSLDDAPLPQVDFLPHVHQHILHVIPDWRYQLDAGLEELLEQRTQIPFVKVAFPLESTEQHFQQGLVVVGNIPRGQHEPDNFPELIDYQVQFEAEEPSHCGLPAPCDAFEGLVALCPFIVAYSQLGRVPEVSAGLLAQPAE